LYVSGGDDRFEVDSETGVVRTKGSEPFPFGKEYEIVKDTPHSADISEDTP